MRTLKFICKCIRKEECIKFARLMQRLEVVWCGTHDVITANNIRWSEEQVVYFINDGHLQRGHNYEFTKNYAKRRECHYEIYIEDITEDLTVNELKSLYHEI